MRVTLSIPPGLRTVWQQTAAGTIVAAGGAFTIAVIGMHPMPDDLDAWVAAALRRETPAGATIDVGRGTDLATAKGWPMRLVDGQVHVDGAVAELRLGAFYRFFEYGGVALARSDAHQPDPTLAQEAIAILATAEPDWSSEVATVDELWRA